MAFGRIVKDAADIFGGHVGVGKAAAVGETVEAAETGLGVYPSPIGLVIVILVGREVRHKISSLAVKIKTEKFITSEAIDSIPRRLGVCQGAN
jgi:cell division ATPase FtsA